MLQIMFILATPIDHTQATPCICTSRPCAYGLSAHMHKYVGIGHQAYIQHALYMLHAGLHDIEQLALVKTQVKHAG